MENRNIPCTKKGTELTETKNNSRFSAFARTLLQEQLLQEVQQELWRLQQDSLERGESVLTQP